MMYEIHTGNTGLDSFPFSLSGPGSERVPFKFDRALTDHQWQLFADGHPVGRPHEIGEHVATDIRRAVLHHRERVETAQEPELAPDPITAPQETENTPAPLLASPGGQFTWQL